MSHYVTCKNFSRNNFLNYDSFIYHDVHSVNIFNISYKNVLTSSDHFYSFSLYFCECSFIMYSVFNDVFYVNNITNIFDLYITCLLNRGNRFLYRNCKVIGESITLFQQENKFKVHKIFITLENNFIFLIIIFIFRFFSRKQYKFLRLCYFAGFWFLVVSLKFLINNDFHFNFSLLQKFQKNGFFNLET